MITNNPAFQSNNLTKRIESIIQMKNSIVAKGIPENMQKVLAESILSIGRQGILKLIKEKNKSKCRIY